MKGVLSTDWNTMKQYVALSFYGDDNMTTVNPQIIHLFNLQAHSKTVSLFGMEVTSAAKDSSLDFKPLKELEFLKRNFVKVGGYNLGKLSINTIQKMLDWTHCNKSHIFNQSPDKVLVTHDISAEIPEILKEVSLHGPDLFKTVYTHILHACKKYSIEPQTLTYTAALNNVGSLTLKVYFPSQYNV
jgi:hypothetical protein